MHNNIRISVGVRILILWAAGAALLPAAGLAQTAPAAGDTSTSGAAENGIQEVLVTARRRSENLQDVPLTVAAVNADAMQAQDVTSLADLNSFVPNMKITADRATSSTINVYIRGVGQDDPLWGAEPGVGVYIDDVYLARPQAALLDVLDVDRIEVLSGPQGTLYGKNTIAGAIKYVTRDIAGPTSLTTSLTFGNYGEKDGRVSFSTPLIADHVYFGVAVAQNYHEGYGEVVAQAGTTPSPYNYIGQDVSNKDILSARANLTILWGESSKLKLMGYTVQDNSNAAGGQRLNDFLAEPLSDPYDLRTDMPVNKDHSYRSGFSATYTQKLTDQLDFKLVGAYAEGDSRQFISFTELNENIFNVPGHYYDHQASGEGQLTFTNELVKAVGGLFYMDSTACGAFDVSYGVDFGFPLAAMYNGCVQTKSTAVYGDTSWKLTDRLNFDAGLRWNQDKKTASVFQGDWAGLLEGNQFFGTPATAPPGFTFIGAVTNYTNNRTFSNVSPRVGFDFHVTDHVMTYFTYSKGFKSGGFDMRGNAALYPATEDGYNSETADNYELGIKSTLLDDTLQLNLAVFYDPYTDAQVELAEYVAPGSLLTAVLNAGKQINRGVELESAWRPLRALTFGLNIGYLDAYYENLAACVAGVAGCPNPAPNAADLNRPINAPTWTVSGNAAYTWVVPGGSLLARAGYDWRSFTKPGYTLPSVTDQPAYGVLNAGLAYTTSNGAWRFAFDGKNLTDKYYRVAGYDFGNPPPSPTNLVGGYSQIGFYGPPRAYGITATYHF
jgi:iron complex outermembrane recepter protein